MSKRCFKMRDRKLNIISFAIQLPFEVSSMSLRFGFVVLWRNLKENGHFIFLYFVNRNSVSVWYPGAPWSPQHPLSEWGGGVGGWNWDSPLTDQHFLTHVSTTTKAFSDLNTCITTFLILLCSPSNIGDAYFPIFGKGVEERAPARKRMGLGWRGCAPQNIAKAESPSSLEANLKEVVKRQMFYSWFPPTGDGGRNGRYRRSNIILRNFPKNESHTTHVLLKSRDNKVCFYKSWNYGVPRNPQTPHRRESRGEGPTPVIDQHLLILILSTAANFDLNIVPQHVFRSYCSQTSFLFVNKIARRSPSNTRQS